MGLDLNTALISDTFDGLIKTTDGNALTGSPLVLTDGRGNDSSLALATAGNGVTITGTLTVGGVDIGVDLATAQSDITAIETKTDFITVTGAVNLDTIKTKADFITVTQAVDLDTIESDIASATAKTQYITVTQAVNLDTMESDILSAKTKTDFITIGQAVNLDNVESGLATAEADIIAIEAKTDYITISSALNLNTVASNASAAKTKTDFLTVTQAVNLDTLESDVNVAKGDITAIEAKTDNITVTQAVNLDTMESDLASSKAKTDFITITQAVNLDTVESGLSQAQTDINLIEAKTNNITVTQAVNLDTMESDIATNNAKNSYPAGDATKVGFISVTQAVDLDSMETDISNLSTNKYDKTGGTISGAVTITGDLTVNGTTTTVNTQTLSVKDPLIELANDNSANSVDTGFYANYSEDAGVTTKYAGLFKDAGDSDKFKLFKGLEVEPTTTVNTAGTGYTKGDLVVNDLDAVTISGTLSTAAQTNITSVGTLSSLAVSGNLTVDTDTLFVDAANNEVGIGTATPERRFHVNSGSTQIGSLFESTSAVSTQINIKNANSTLGGFIKTTGDNIILTANNTGVDHLVVADGGNVGIGISSPATKVDIAANNNGGTALNVLRFTDTDITSAPNQESGRIEFYTSDGSSAGVASYISGVTGTGAEGRLIFATGLGGAAAERMRIDSSGNVGIGTASPASIFHVSGGGNKLLKYDASVNRVKLNSEYDASGTTEVDIFFETRSGGNWRTNSIKSASNALIFSTGGTGSDAVPTERIRIDSDGNVGIGTLPSRLLHVNSGGTNDVALFESTDSIARISIKDNTAKTDLNHNTGQFTVDVDPDNVGVGSLFIIRLDDSEKLRVLTGGGIAFNGDTAAANALDDYEEGTFTPVYTTVDGDFDTIDYSTQTGRYTKIGRAVYCDLMLRAGNITYSGAVTSSSDVRVGGLPFTSIGGISIAGASISFINNWGNTNNPNAARLRALSTQIDLVQLRDTASSYDILVSDLDSGAAATRNDIRMSFFYFV